MIELDSANETKGKKKHLLATKVSKHERKNQHGVKDHYFLYTGTTLQSQIHISPCLLKNNIYKQTQKREQNIDTNTVTHPCEFKTCGKAPFKRGNPCWTSG